MTQDDPFNFDLPDELATDKQFEWLWKRVSLVAKLCDQPPLEVFAEIVIKCNPEVSAQIKAGKLPAVQSLIGFGMKISQGRINATKFKEILLSQLSK